MACYRYTVVNSGTQKAFGTYIEDATGNELPWICGPNRRITIQGVRDSTIKGDNPTYFDSYITVTRVSTCGGDLPDVSNCAVNIEAVEVTPNTSIGNTNPNGQATLDIGESIIPYEFSIDGLFYQDSNVFTDLADGNYTAHVRNKLDAECFASRAFTIIKSTPVLFAYAEVNKNTSIIGGVDGEIYVEVVSGSGNYQVIFDHDEVVHNLDSGELSQSMIKTGLAAGEYSLTVTDIANGSSKVFNLTIIDPATDVETPGNFFEVPAMNSLHFVIEDLNAPQTPDNRLLINQFYPGFERTNYFQPVEKADFITTQVNTNYKHLKAQLFNYATKQLVKTFQPPVKRESNLGATADFNVRIQNHSVPGQCRVYFTDGPPPIPVQLDRTFEILNSNEGFDGIYRPLTLQTDVNLGYEYIIINKVWDQPAEITSVFAVGRFDNSTASFDVYEFFHTFLDVDNGCYFIRITAYDDLSQMVAETEPIDLQLEHRNCLLMEYRNIDNAFGLSFSHGYTGIIRVPALLGHKRKPGGERTTSRNSDFSLVKVSAKKQRIFDFETFMLPPWLHEKISVILDTDNWSINKIPYQCSEAYADPSYLDRFLLANSTARIEQAKWFDRYNSDDISTVAEGGGFILGKDEGYIKR